MITKASHSLLTTREKILQESRKYFNEHGYAASSLYQIAQTIGISRGNLTYHFADKEILLELHLEELKSLHEQSLINSVVVPSWQSLNKATEDFHKIQQDYAFVFFDKTVLAIATVRELIQSLRANNIKTQMSMINISIQMGNMKPEPFSGVYHNISRSFWMISYFWLISKSFAATQDVSWDKVMWSMLLPHFTEKGIDSFKEHFGEDYFGSLGVAYEKYLGASIAF